MDDPLRPQSGIDAFRKSRFIRQGEQYGLNRGRRELLQAQRFLGIDRMADHENIDLACAGSTLRDKLLSGLRIGLGDDLKPA